MIFALVNDMNAQTLGLIHRIGFNTSCSEYSQNSHMEILLDVALFYASIFWLTFLVLAFIEENMSFIENAILILKNAPFHII